MTQVAELKSPVQNVEFAELNGSSSVEDRMEKMMPDLGVVYVTSITRDGCSGCMEQKPLFNELAAKMSGQHSSLVSFARIHIQYSDANVAQSAEAKRMFRHGAYPTYMVHVRSRFGPLELYRAIYPSMSDLEKQVGESLELAEYYKTDAEKNQR